MPAKNVYLPPEVLKWLELQAKKEERGFSNYLAKLVRERMKQQHWQERAREDGE